MAKHSSHPTLVDEGYFNDTERAFKALAHTLAG